MGYRHHPDCYLTTDSNAATVALAVDSNKLEGFPTLKVSKSVLHFYHLVFITYKRNESVSASEGNLGLEGLGAKIKPR